MVVGRYRRTISFPNLNSSKNPNTPSKAYHVRSTSLPCERTHPSIPQLNLQISNLISWPQSKPIITSTKTTSSWLLNGLTQLNTVVDSLNQVFQIPFIHDTLTKSGCPRLVEKLLEHFLRFLDVFGVFHSCLLSLKNEASTVQVALRRKDQAKIIAYVKFHKKMTKEMVKLLSTVDRQIDGEDQPDEISTLIHDVLDLTSSVSAAVLESVLTLLGSNRRKTYSWVGLKKKAKREDQNDVVEGMEYQLEQLVYKKKGEDRWRILNKMQEMEECVGSLELSSGRVLRTLITTRVSLLNILTHF